MRFSEQEIQRASKVNIVSLAQDMGMEVRKIGTKEYKVPGYGGLIINLDGTKWHWFSESKGGTAIQFMMEFGKLSWRRAIEELLDKKYRNYEVSRSRSNIQKNKKKFILPERSKNNKRMIEYLITKRGLSVNTVSKFIKENKLYQDSKGNCVFMGYDENNKPKYASFRGTSNKPYKGDVSGSSKQFAFSKKGCSKKLYVFESPIDLMSYIDLAHIYDFQNIDHHHMISMGGICKLAVDNYLQQHSIEKIILCVDNDQAGSACCNNFHEVYGSSYTIIRHVPKMKDFNDDLKKVKEQVEAAEFCMVENEDLLNER